MTIELILSVPLSFGSLDKQLSVNMVKDSLRRSSEISRVNSFLYACKRMESIQSFEDLTSYMPSQAIKINYRFWVISISLMSGKHVTGYFSADNFSTFFMSKSPKALETAS